MQSAIEITKASGEKSFFSESLLRKSLQRAGATHDQASQIIEQIKPQLYEGISTRKIYRMAFGLLRGASRSLAARYHLKRGIMELGPSGFPFEKYLGEILAHQGYTVQIGQIIQGKCVTHEIDVIATKDNHQYLVECKFHNQPGTISDVKIPLYIHSRFQDVHYTLQQTNKEKIYQGWVVTNTRFSTDAVTYGLCAGLTLLGWDFPAGNGLREQIDELGLYPLTCLTTLTRLEKQRLLDMGIVLCSELNKREDILVKIISKRTRISTIKKESEELCSYLKTKKK